MKEKSPNKDVHLLYKNLGETPNEAILRYKAENPIYKDQSMTYAGRLDPMAEGLLLVLSGNELQNKDKYLGLRKTYEVEILWGFQTDTLDVLGLVQENSLNHFSRGDSRSASARERANLEPPNYACSSREVVNKNFLEKIESTNFPEVVIKNLPEIQNLKNQLEKSVGKFEQHYPAYSSKPVSGKSLFMWAREGRLSEIEIPSHEVELYKAEYISRRTISKEELRKNIIEKIALVKGDFRQDETLSGWQKVLDESLESEYIVDSIRLEVSSGFYVRQFVKDLAHSLGTVATTLHIKRLSIGEYQIGQ